MKQKRSSACSEIVTDVLMRSLAVKDIDVIAISLVGDNKMILTCK